MNIDSNLMIAYVVGIIILFLLARTMLGPTKIVLKLIFNAIIGGVAILIINLMAGASSFYIAFNAFTAVIVGFLGIPGIMLLATLKYLFNV